MSENLKILAKLFGSATRSQSVGGSSVAPNYWARATPLARFSRAQSKPGKPTGNYPKNWFKGGHPGNIYSRQAARGIAPPVPNTNPGPSQNFGTQTGGPVALPTPAGDKT